jgi:hypothetical protein
LFLDGNFLIKNIRLSGMKLRFNPLSKGSIFYLLLAVFFFVLSCCHRSDDKGKPVKLRILAGMNEEFAEPFGLAIGSDGSIYVSDGGKGAIFKISIKTKQFSGGLFEKKKISSTTTDELVMVELLTDKLQTPSQIAFDNENFLIVADSGSHTIKRINVQSGEIQIVAGVEGKKGFADGNAHSALFNAPVGVAVWQDKIFVADTYNDKIRVIENGIVRTLAGSSQGFADGVAENAKFDTPASIVALSDGSLIVSDIANGKLRKLSQTGSVETVEIRNENSVEIQEGNLSELKKGYLLPFTSQPIAIFAKDDELFFADTNSLYQVKKIFTPEITIEKFDFPTNLLRPSSIAVDKQKNIFIADSDSRLIALLTASEDFVELTEERIGNMLDNQYKLPLSVRWCYNPAERRRDIAGTFCEIRGELQNHTDEARFHNGIDIAGGYGETVHFVQTEKVLLLDAVSDFGNSRESLRMPKFGYVHVNLGRYADSRVFDDDRFQFSFNEMGKPINLRIARGTKFEAGEPIGTLNTMNHVHLIVGISGYERNPLDVLSLPNLSDKIAPIIEKVELFDENWQKIETGKKNFRLSGKVRIVVEAFDRMDGNPQRRKLGVYRVGYQVFQDEKLIIDKLWTMTFSHLPKQIKTSSQTSLVYALGSRASSSGESFFRYIVSNELDRNRYIKENFLNVDSLNEGRYTLRVSVADFFGNITSKEIQFVR